MIKISKGIIVSIVGIPNAGKSTLLNTLLKEEKAIVSSIEGTTRDIVESSIYLDGVKITFQDTAGFKDFTEDVIEKEGISRAVKSIDQADIVIFVLDSSKEMSEQKALFESLLKNHSHKIIEVYSKSDLNNQGDIKISAAQGKVDELLSAINIFIKDHIFNNDENNNFFLITQQQVDNFFCCFR